MDLSIVFRRTKEDLVNVLNASGLPYDVMAYALKEVLKEVETLAEDNYRTQIALEQKKQQEQARAEELKKLQEEAKEREKEMEEKDPEEENPEDLENYPFPEVLQE